MKKSICKISHNKDRFTWAEFNLHQTLKNQKLIRWLGNFANQLHAPSKSKGKFGHKGRCLFFCFQSRKNLNRAQLQNRRILRVVIKTKIIVLKYLRNLTRKLIQSISYFMLCLIFQTYWVRLFQVPILFNRLYSNLNVH